MPIYKIKLVERLQVAKDTLVFNFEKPAGFNFIPGQYVGLTLINPLEKDLSALTRRFSILSTPDDPYISIATRIQPSPYKRALTALAIGSEIKLAGPIGGFILHDDAHIPAVLIAGGIGIAPFFSMIKYRTRQHAIQPLYLFYGNQTADDAAFSAELIALTKANPHFTFIPALTSPEDKWTGETGFITHTMIKKYITDLSLPIYYICGSPAMVVALQETLIEMGIAEDKIRVEDFPGY